LIFLQRNQAQPWRNHRPAHKRNQRNRPPIGDGAVARLRVGFGTTLHFGRTVLMGPRSTREHTSENANIYGLHAGREGLTAKRWHTYPLGFLFGLGFNTATEIGLLGISAAAAGD
jgi:hypothetical protein